MNWRLESLCTFYLLLPLLVNSLTTENVGKENATSTAHAFNVSKRIITNDTFEKYNKTKLNEKSNTCISGCKDSVANRNGSEWNTSKFNATKASRNNTESDESGEEKDFIASDTHRRGRKLDRYLWEKEVFTGRSKEMQVLLPLVIGFKLTGIISSGFTAIKIFLLQSMFIAKLAVIASAIVLLKIYKDFRKHKPMMHKGVLGFNPYHEYAMPYHSAGYDEALSYPVGYDNGQWHGVDVGDTDIGTAKDDLDTQFSETQPVVADRGNKTTTTYSSNYYSQRDYTADERQSNSSFREKYKPQIIGYETYIKRITTKRED